MTEDKIDLLSKETDIDIRLAVDIIYILEINQIPLETALSAIKIVEQDLLNKLKKQQ